MRFLFAGLAIASLLAAAAYSTDRTIHPLTYANAVSRSFAGGDNDDHSGWRECLEAEKNAHETGVICEGTRSIAVHGLQMVTVNYFCEFQFKPLSNGSFRVGHALCQ